MANRFISDELETIDLWDWDFIKIKKEVSYWDTIKIFKKTDTDTVINMFVIAIKEWNLKDKDWNIVELTEENIKKLDLETWKILTEKVNKLFFDSSDTKKK